MQQQKNGMAIASLVLGIVSIVFIWIYWGVGILAAVVGLILGIIARNQSPNTMATAGIVLSVIALAVNIVVVIACVACVSCIIAFA